LGHRLAVAAAACASVALSMACSSSGEQESPQVADASADGAASPDATIDASAPEEASIEAAADAPAIDLDAGLDAAPEATTDGGPPCALDSAGEPTELRCTGLYSDWASRTVASDVQLYDPGLHLWSDGAVKTRWVYLPPGTTIDTSNMDEWVFPVGTKFWKQFVVDGVLTETRLLHKVDALSWYATTYAWSTDGATTTEMTVGAMNVNDSGYEIPSQPKCAQCHQGRGDFVLGFEAVSLSSPGASGLPMATLKSRNLLTAPPSAPITVPGNPTEAAALGYLHANCGTTCHNPGSGLAGSTGFFLRLNVSQLASVAATDAVQTGWNVATRGFHAVPERIAQCSVENSCVHYRMSRRDGVDGAIPGTQMPPIDTHQVDLAGESLIAAWITQGCDAGADGGP
jgi:hypothetical protein